MDRSPWVLLAVLWLNAFLFSHSIQAQEAGVVSGIVRSAANNQALASAVVEIIETNQFSSTGNDGRFVIRN